MKYIINTLLLLLFINFISSKEDISCNCGYECSKKTSVESRTLVALYYHTCGNRYTGCSYKFQSIAKDESKYKIYVTGIKDCHKYFYEGYSKLLYNTEYSSTTSSTCYSFDTYEKRYEGICIVAECNNSYYDCPISNNLIVG